MAKKYNFGENKKFFMGLVVGFLVAATVFYVLSPTGRFITDPKDTVNDLASQNPLVVGVRNPSFEKDTNDWVFEQLDPDVKIEYSSAWASHGARSIKVYGTPSNSLTETKPVQVFTAPSRASTLTVDLNVVAPSKSARYDVAVCLYEPAKGGNLAGYRYGTCGWTSHYVGSGTHKLSTWIPEEVKGKTAVLYLYGPETYGSVEYYWDNVNVE